jgi:hypothetical protein
MNKLRLLVLGFLGSCAVGVLAVNCGAADAIFDCQSVCQRYHDCYDSTYDVGACRNRCRTASSNDPNVRRAADDCEACISGQSCVGATFSCGLTCGTIVPG